MSKLVKVVVNRNDGFLLGKLGQDLSRGNVGVGRHGWRRRTHTRSDKTQPRFVVSQPVQAAVGDRRIQIRRKSVSVVEVLAHVQKFKKDLVQDVVCLVEIAQDASRAPRSGMPTSLVKLGNPCAVRTAHGMASCSQE